MVGEFATDVDATVVVPRVCRLYCDGNVFPLRNHCGTVRTMQSVMIRFGWYCFKLGTGVIDSTGTWRPVENWAFTSSGAGPSGYVLTIVVLELREHVFELLVCMNDIYLNAMCPSSHVAEASIASVQDLVDQVEDVVREVPSVEAKHLATEAAASIDDISDKVADAVPDIDAVLESKLVDDISENVEEEVPDVSGMAGGTDVVAKAPILAMQDIVDKVEDAVPELPTSHAAN